MLDAVQSCGRRPEVTLSALDPLGLVDVTDGDSPTSACRSACCRRHPRGHRPRRPTGPGHRPGALGSWPTGSARVGRRSRGPWPNTGCLFAWPTAPLTTTGGCWPMPPPLASPPRSPASWICRCCWRRPTPPWRRRGGSGPTPRRCWPMSTAPPRSWFASPPRSSTTNRSRLASPGRVGSGTAWTCGPAAYTALRATSASPWVSAVDLAA
jgi:hypothetical protein